MKRFIRTNIFSYPELPLEPPEDDNFRELQDEEEIVEVQIDDIVVVDSEGNWEFEDKEYPWAYSPYTSNGDWISDLYNRTLSNAQDMAYNVEDIIESRIPADPGRYKITCEVQMVYVFSNILDVGVTEPEIDLDSIEVEFSREKSKITRFTYSKQ